MMLAPLRCSFLGKTVGYADFDEFLADLPSSEAQRKIRQERRRVTGIRWRVRRLVGPKFTTNTGAFHALLRTTPPARMTRRPISIWSSSAGWARRSPSNL